MPHSRSSRSKLYRFAMKGKAIGRGLISPTDSAEEALNWRGYDFLALTRNRPQYDHQACAVAREA